MEIHEDVAKESFEEFKNSISYGKRNDLNFKFLSHMNDRSAADFFQGLLAKTGASLNDGSFSRVIEHLIEGQIKAYAGPAKFTYTERPFFQFRKDLSRVKIGLLTSTGHFVAGDDPKPLGAPDMTQDEAIQRINEFLKAKPVLSKIPINTPKENLRIRHGGYDISGAQADHDTVFPLETLKTMEQQGIIGDVASEAYSFVGACSQIQLQKQAGPEWVDQLKKKEIEAVLLVPV